MKTRCYCVGCKLHPFHEKREEFAKERWITGWSVGRFIWEKENQVANVDCLKPESSAFSDLDIDPKDHEFPVTAYGDGVAETGFESDDFSYIIRAYCANEQHED